MLSFAIVYFFESGLFNGLQSIQTKKFFFSLNSLPGCVATLRKRSSLSFLTLEAGAQPMPMPAQAGVLHGFAGPQPQCPLTRERKDEPAIPSHSVLLAPTVAQSGELKSIALISILRNELIFAHQGPGALRPSSERGPDALFQAPPTELGGPSSSAKSASART
jgi:hypothetical protein